MRVIVAASIAAWLLALSACENESGCEQAKDTIEPLVDKVCDEAAYKTSPFCACCVAQKLYSVDDDCTCRALNFDAEVCLYSKGKQAMPQIRSAVEFANRICARRIPSLPEGVTEGPACANLRANEADAGSDGD